MPQPQLSLLACLPPLCRAIYLNGEIKFTYMLPGPLMNLVNKLNSLMSVYSPGWSLGNTLPEGVWSHRVAWEQGDRVDLSQG